MSNWICAVCCNLLTEPMNIYPGKRKEDYHPVATECGHLFHKECLFHSLTLQNTGVSKACPECKISLRNNSVVELFFESGENFQDYSTLLQTVNQGTLYMTVICHELESIKKDLLLLRHIRSQKRMAAAKQAKQLRNLQMQVDSLQEENQLLAVERKVLKDDFEKFRKSSEISFRILEENAKNAGNSGDVIRSIIQVLKNLECSKEESEGEDFQRRFTNADEIINKIGEILINDPSGDAETTSQLKKVFMRATFPDHHSEDHA